MSCRWCKPSARNRTTPEPGSGTLVAEMDDEEPFRQQLDVLVMLRTLASNGAAACSHRRQPAVSLWFSNWPRKKVPTGRQDLRYEPQVSSCHLLGINNTNRLSASTIDILSR